MTSWKRAPKGHDPFLVKFRTGYIYHSVADEESLVVVTGRTKDGISVRGSLNGDYKVERYTDRNGKPSEFIVDRNRDTMRIRLAFYALDEVGEAEKEGER